MRRYARLVLFSACVLLVSVALWSQQASAAQKREHFQSADVIYGWVPTILTWKREQLK